MTTTVKIIEHKAEKMKLAADNIRDVIDGIGGEKTSIKTCSDLLTMISDKTGIDKETLVDMIGR